MMRLPGLEPHERAYLNTQQQNGPVPSFASRLQQRLTASVGVPVVVREAPVAGVADVPAGDEPAIAIQPELSAAWLALRLGGRPGKVCAALKDHSLAQTFKALIRRTLAESIFNAGESVWPNHMRLQMIMADTPGEVDIVWNSVHAWHWARRVIKEKA